MGIANAEFGVSYVEECRRTSKPCGWIVGQVYEALGCHLGESGEEVIILLILLALNVMHLWCMKLKR